MPPMDKRAAPTVYVDYYSMDTADILSICKIPSGRKVAACEFPSPSPAHPDRRVIVYDNRLVGNDLECILTYERAHVPPNNWLDPVREYGAKPGH